MATLEIRKKSLKTWLHVPSDASNFILSKFYCKTDASTFKIVEESGSNRREYSYTDITVYDDTDIGTPETFASAQALMLRLEALKYTGFNRDGDIPTSYIESVVAGTNVTIDDTDPLNPIISSTGGGGTQDLQSVTNYGNSTTNSLNIQYGDEYTNVFTSNVVTADNINNSYVFIENTGTIGVNSGDFEGTIKATNLTTNNVNLEFPQKTAGSYTIATTSDLSGFGDMSKSVYDTDDDGIVDSAKKEIVQFINKSGSTITKGTIVYLKSTSSSSTYPEVLKANASTEATSSKTIGAVFEDVANDATGYLVTSGEVRNLDTSAYVIGDKLWLSTTDGLVTTTVPTQPNHAVFIGTVTRAQSVNGRILYAIQNGYELNELHNVLIASPANNEVLTYESSTSLWKNKVINQGSVLTREEFSYTSSQDFTLASTPSSIYAVFVNGQELNSSQYSFVTTTLTVSDTLESGDKINILYTPVTSGVLDYYTKAQIDGFLTNSNIESIIGQASASNSGYLSSTDWTDFDAKQDAITLTTNNYSGVATLIGSTLNIPNYEGFIPKLKGHETFRGVNYSNNSTTEVTSGGITIATTGSTIARSVSSTNYALKQVRKGFYASVVSAGRYTGTRGSALLFYLGGGFKYVCDVFISDTAYGSGCRQFYGMAGQTTDLAYSDTVLVSSLTNLFGVGSDALDTNLQIFHNDGTGTATKIDLGANFPANRTAGSALTTVYSIELFNDSNSTDVKYCVKNKETGSVAMGTISTNLPLDTQGLNFFASRCMGAGVTNTGQFDLLTLGTYSL